MDEEKNNETYIPEQLDDEDFEKEKEEEKRLKKERKNQKKAEKKFISDDEDGVETKHKKSNKKNIFFILLLIIIIVAGCGFYYFKYVKNENGSYPEDSIKDLCAFFNSRNWDRVNELIDIKGYYILGIVLEEEEYTKFDEAYNNFIEDETYTKFIDRLSEYLSLDNEVLTELVSDVKITVNSIENSVKIQNTENLYKIKVNFNVYAQGQSQDMTEDIYVTKVNGEYKIIFGYLPDIILNIYQSGYSYQSYYGN